MRTLDAGAMARVKALLSGLSLDEQEELHEHLARLVTPAAVEGPVAELAARAEPAYVYRSERVRCGKKGCACAKGKLHGPYVYKTWREAGKLRKKYVGKAQPAQRPGSGSPRA